MNEQLPPPPALDADRAAYERGELSADLQAQLLNAIVADTVDKVPTWRDKVQAMPTRWRVACAVSSMTLISAASMLPGIRPDLVEITDLHFLFGLALLLAIAAWGTALALRGTYRRPLGPWATRLALVTVLLPLGFLMIPNWWPGMPTPPDLMAIKTIKCGFAGLVGAVVAAMVQVVFMRDQPLRRWRLAAASGGAGLMGMLFRSVHCPYNDLLHMFLAHALLGVATGGLIIAGVGIAQRWRHGRAASEDPG